MMTYHENEKKKIGKILLWTNKYVNIDNMKESIQGN